MKDLTYLVGWMVFALVCGWGLTVCIIDLEKATERLEEVTTRLVYLEAALTEDMPAVIFDDGLLLPDGSEYPSLGPPLEFEDGKILLPDGAEDPQTAPGFVFQAMDDGTSHWVSISGSSTQGQRLRCEHLDFDVDGDGIVEAYLDEDCTWHGTIEVAE